MAAVLIDISDTAGPGQAFQLVGDGLSATPTLRISRVNGHEAALTTPPATAQAPLEVVAWGTQMVQARVPYALAPGLYAVWVSPDDGATWSAPAYINRARVTHWQWKECSTGHRIRAFGRNLVAASRMPTVLVGGIAAQVNLADSDSEILDITWPAGLTLTTAYAPVVNNGHGGVYGDHTSPATVVHRAGGVDVFGLGTPYGADFEAISKNVVTSAVVADGATNIRAALQAEIEAIKVAGGVLDLTATGTYVVGTDSFTRNGWIALPSNVVIRLGPGAILQFGSGGGAGTHYGIAADTNASKCGVIGGTITQAAATGAKVNGLVSLGGGTSKVFQKGSNLQTVEQTLFVGVQNSDQSVIRDNVCTATPTAGAGTQTPWDLQKATYAWFYNNSGKWNVGRGVNCSHTQGPVTIERNTFAIDGSVNGATERGSIEASATWKLAVLRNTFRVSPLYDLLDTDNDRECINSQYTGVAGRIFVGTVTSATANTLTDTSKNWSVNLFVPPVTLAQNMPDHVSIVGGKGMGQTRRILSNTADTATLESDWLVIPDATSRYTIDGWSGMDWLIKKNRLADQYRGIELYASAYRALVKDNELVDSEFIMSWPQHRLGLADKRLTKAWHVAIHDNTLRVTPANLATKRAGIDVRMNHYEASDSTWPTIFGVGALGSDIRRNTLYASPTVDVTNGGDRIHSGVGVRVEVIHSATGVSEGARDPANPGNLGAIVEDNRVVAASGKSYRVGTGTALVLIDDASPTAATPQITDTLGTGMTVGAVGLRSALSVAERKARRREGR